MARKKVQVRDGSGEPKEAVLAPEVDLDATDVRDSRGRRVTEEYAASAAAEALAVVSRGRPSLSGDRGTDSPQVTFRLSPQLRAKVEARAAAEGRKVSDIAREALERYVG